jgi:hypothetical protein
MRFFLPPVEIGDTEGFTKSKDIFERAALGEGLTNVVTTVSEPLVIALDGQWGSGKTTFLKMWAGELRKKHFPVVYLDAFRHDYSDDAFTAVASEIIALAGSRRKSTKAFLDKAVGVGKVILQSGLKIGVKVGTLGVLDGADIETAASDIAKEASDIMDKYVGDLLTKHKQQEGVIDAFKKALTELPSLLSTNGTNESPMKPLVVIIDELDRCRPVFALELLERIKHFFSVPNVHFVLGAHLGQLNNSVKVAYGSEIDANLYLQKFIHLTVHLVDANKQFDKWATTRFLKYVLTQLELEVDQHLNYTVEFITHVAQSHNLSFRTLERIMSTVAMTFAFNGGSILPSELVAGLSVLKTTHPDLYIKAKIGTLTFDEIRVPLAFYVVPDEGNKHMMQEGQMVWMYGLNVQNVPGEVVQQKFAEYRQSFRMEGPRLVSAITIAIDRLMLLPK